ncbi:MAG: hypothetical protein PHV12_07395, partial [Bacteroidales bacterium]|nr:hypothetical protein [Bacteroidales bacterium]
MDNTGEYINEGYYSDSGTTTKENATLITPGDEGVVGKDISLLKASQGITIQGRINLPGAALTTHVDGHVYATASDKQYYGYFNIPAGQTYADYEIEVDADKAYTINYWINSQDFMQEGYYGQSGTTSYSEEAYPVNVAGSSITGIDLTLLQGVAISGNIIVPEGTTIPEGGISVHLNADSTDGSGLHYYSNIIINQNQTIVPYRINVTSDHNYKIHYFQYDNKVDLVENSYYNNNQGWSDYETAVDIYVPAGGTSGKDIELVKGYPISGTVTFNPAPPESENMYVEVMAKPDGYYNDFRASVNFENGSSTAQYNLVVPVINDSPGYYINYTIPNSDTKGYIGKGYYNSGGTTFKKYAELVDISNGGKDGINMTIDQGYTISGDIILPEPVSGEAIHGSLYINLMDSSKEDKYDNSYPFTIETSQSSTTYSVVVRPNLEGDSYRVGYESWSNSNYLREGYYNSTGTTNYNNATPVVVSGGNVSDIDLNILEGKKISGRITIPTPAPESGLELWLHAKLLNDKYGNEVNVIIPSGETYADYAISVDGNNDYILSYSIKTEQTTYYNYGYYSDVSGVAYYDNASTISVGDTDVTGINMSIPIFNYDSVPQDIIENETLGADFNATLNVDGINTKLDNTKVWLEGNYRSENNYEAVLSYDTDSKKITASFTDVQPGNYRIYASSGNGLKLYRDNTIFVDSYGSKAVVNRKSRWAISDRWTGFNMVFYGIRLNELLNNDGKLDAELVDSTGNVIATTLKSDGSQLPFEINPDGGRINMDFRKVSDVSMPVGSYKLRVNSSNWSVDSSWRTEDFQVISETFVGDNCYPDVLGADYPNFAVEVQARNMDRFDSSKTLAFELKDTDTGTIYNERVLVTSADMKYDDGGNGWIYVDFINKPIPASVKEVKLTVGYVLTDNSIIPMPGGDRFAFRVTDKDEIYDVYFDKYEPYTDYTITIKGWNITDGLKANIRKEDQIIKTIDNLTVNSDGTEATSSISFSQPLTPGDYDVEIFNSTKKYGWWGWWIDDNSTNPNMHIEFVPSIIQEQQAPNGASFDAVIATQNMPNLDLSSIHVSLFDWYGPLKYEPTLSFDSS